MIIETSQLHPNLAEECIAEMRVNLLFLITIARFSKPVVKNGFHNEPLYGRGIHSDVKPRYTSVDVYIYKIKQNVYTFSFIVFAL